MSIAGTVGKVVTTIIKPVADAYIKNQERKQAKESAKSKIKLAKDEQTNKVDLKDAEWEVVAKSLEDKTWKDEYVTVTIISPVNLIIVGAIYGAFSQDYRVLEGTTAGIQALTVVGLDYGVVLTAVVFAAIGLKMWRS